MSMLDAIIRQAETRWPQLRFKREMQNEASAACPFCGQGEDRFRLWVEGNYWCRRCGQKGFVDEKESSWSKLSDHERRLRRLEAEQRRQRARLERQELRLSALEKMARCQDHLRYHRNLAEKDPDNVALEYWLSEGITPASITEYKLGICFRCPTDHEGRPSYTIPVVSNGRLWNIRHRLMNAPSGDKYRPHMAGLPNVLFNADDLRADKTRSIAIVEGEKKSIVASQLGITNVGIIGKTGFKPAWAGRFDRFRNVYVALDPDATEQAVEIAALFGRRGRVVILPDKFDDLVVRHGATKDDMRWFFALGRPV